MKRNIYLSNYSLEEAKEKFFKSISIKERYEEIDVENSQNRISYESVYAKQNNPYNNCSAMDGIATISKKTELATNKNLVRLKKDIDYVFVDTGDVIPKGFDTVIMIEDLIQVDENTVEIYKGSTLWENIRSLGEDIVETSLIVPRKSKIRPVDIAAMIAGGIRKIKVYKKPLVGIIPTGDEIVEPYMEMKEGSIVEFNSRMFQGMLKDYGAESIRYGIVKDDFQKLKKAVTTAVKECDMVIVIAGSSAGREDFTKKIISDIGEVIIHGIAIKPGNPAILGEVDKKIVVGLPGYPVSAYFVMENIVKDIIFSFIGVSRREDEYVEAILSKRIMSSLKYLEFVRVKLGYVDDKLYATPIQRGSGMVMSLVNCDGILTILQDVEGFEKGSKVYIKLNRDLKEIKNTAVLIGSHDPILDVATDYMRVFNNKYNLSSTHLGSMGGILALKNDECHMATIHLLDTDTGIYNESYIRKYLYDEEIVLVSYVKRIQGIMVRSELKDKIKSLEDIKNLKLRYINRQRGSGTRVLFDYNLKKLGIKPSEIKGYHREELTHLGVAAAIKKGDGDCGLGVLSAAKIMGLEFIKIAEESYDIAIKKKYLELESVKAFFKVINSDEYKKKLDELSGYDYKEMLQMKFLK